MSQTSYRARIKAPGPGAPLVFAFHGTGGDENQFFGLVDQILPEAGIVSPRGDVSEAGANRFFRRTGEGVYDMEDLAERVVRMTGFLRAHTAAHPGAPVIGLGYSNGANILASVLFEAPDIFDRAVLMHPLIPWTPQDATGLAGAEILLTAGRRDPICPLPLTMALISYFRRQHSAVSEVLHDGGHEIREEEITALGRFLTRPFDQQ